MRKTFFTLFLILFFSNQSFSQSQNFKIQNMGRKYSEKELVTALFNADWCGYFHESSRYTITFDDGATVELLSKKEISSSEKLNDACFQNENIKDNGIYKIHESGALVRMLSARNTSKN